MRFNNSSQSATSLRNAAFLLLCLPSCFAQSSAGVLSIAALPKLAARRNEVIVIKLPVQLRPGYHVNSNIPSEDYMIPLRLTWDAAPLQVGEVIYPKPVQEQYQFAAKPLSVFTGDFEILTRMKVPPAAAPGLGILSGRLRYQACNDKLCLPPKTIDVRVSYEIR